jgi:hypothetical protein
MALASKDLASDSLKPLVVGHMLKICLSISVQSIGASQLLLHTVMCCTHLGAIPSGTRVCIAHHAMELG